MSWSFLTIFFGCGSIYRNRRHDNHREDLMVYNVWNRRDLSGIIVPFFEANPLRTAKQQEFIKFARILKMMEHRMHLTHEGLRRIAEIQQTMNHRKPSRFLESSEAIRQPTLRNEELKRWSRLHGDMKEPRSEIPCRVDELPLERAISLATPANNGETLTPKRRAIPWEVESMKLFDPVTTEAKAETASTVATTNPLTP
jgi:hypothetical protein